MLSVIETESWRDLEVITPRAAIHYRDLPFHGFPHALETSAEVRIIADDYAQHGTALAEEEIEDAQIGMLYHDAGFFVPIHLHPFQSKEAYSSCLMEADQRELGMPEKRIQRIGGGILSTQLQIPPKTRVAKVMRQADLSNVARLPALQVVRNTVRLFREDAILKREYGHHGEIKTDLLSFVIGQYGVMGTYNQDDVAIGASDYVNDGRCNFAAMLENGMECFLPDRAADILRKLGLISSESDTTNQTAS